MGATGMSILLRVAKLYQKDVAELKDTITDLEAQLEACEAANARLLAESRIKAAPDYQAGGWRQHETRRL